MFRTTLRACVAALTLAVTAAGLTVAATGPAAAADAYTVYERSVVKAVNARRAARGLAPLRTRTPSAQCADRSFTEPWAVRMQHVGRVRYHDLGHVGRFCPGVRFEESAARTVAGPKKLVAAWMAKPVHRRGLMAPDRRSIAVAAVRNRRGTWTVSLLTSARGDAPARTGGTDGATPAPAITAEEYRDQVYAGTDQVRSYSGLAPLPILECAETFAQKHAEAMAAAHTLEHSATADRDAACGLRTGENVGLHSSDDPDAMVLAWTMSPGHHGNMIDVDYTHIGIGAARGSDGVWYAVQVFSTLTPAEVTEPTEEWTCDDVPVPYGCPDPTLDAADPNVF